MPKEVTHWLIAQQTAAALRGTCLGVAAEACPNCLMLGAVLHDAAFYARHNLRKTAMAGFADAMHGKGHDPFAVIGSVMKAETSSGHPGPVRALLIGMLSHIAADSCFHPLVYHVTGNYHDPDPVKRSLCIERHRGFETALDVYLAGTYAAVRTFSLKHYMRCCEVPVEMLLHKAFHQAAVDFSLPDLPDSLLHCLTVFSRMQSLYAAPVCTRMLELLWPLLPAGGREIAALFYLPNQVRQAPGLHGMRSFTDFEGRAMSCSILDLYQKAIARSSELCRGLEPCLNGTQPFSPPRMQLVHCDFPQAFPACAPGA